ncbi:hypothetical protein PUNSTDRAFT_124942 [Punctularia strigosozonata HHB-11173 SS5]|uniref:uncharacterized protein n=1 Tax=Punctularia strigosozonata (strain HHB-11173) TaxID=741275 RepID=UPI0004418633|nr:uncharacterized protein PUNSTDRAFT_124942 [Punctularia strigosozonata HHB-11173 SS5]EIN11725.1 hypothetical protein PUNSTDRAFT_124942 [Punctularia strigosozonata HHB-11173 SS5]
MPTRAQRGLRHARNASAGSSKAGLNLHFTQKEPAPPKAVGQAKKHGEVLTRTGSGLGRTNSAVRVQSKDQIAPAHPKKSAGAHAGHRKGVTTSSRHKAGFTIASPSTDDEDEDEWISSEAPSGAATPKQTESDDEEEEEVAPPPQPRPPQHQQQFQVPPAQHAKPPTNGAIITSGSSQQVTTPQAAPQTPAPPPQTRVTAATPRTPETPSTSSPPSPSTPIDTRPPLARQLGANGYGTRSAATSPTHHDDARFRRSVTRPPSTHSVTRLDAPLRPHPLIRAHSQGRDSLLTVSSKPAPLAPLMTADTPRAQLHTLSASPPSPASTRTETTASPELPSPSHTSTQNRRTSISSARSVATMPVLTQTPTSAVSSMNWAPHDRTRTMSTMSSSSASSLAAIASRSGAVKRSVQAQQHAQTHYICHLPPLPPAGVLEATRPLLPQPYLSQHVNVLSYRNPMQESYDRVIRAKYGRVR